MSHDIATLAMDLMDNIAADAAESGEDLEVVTAVIVVGFKQDDRVYLRYQATTDIPWEIRGLLHNAVDHVGREV